MQDVNMRNLGTRIARHVKDTCANGREAQDTLESIAELMGHTSIESLMAHLDGEWDDQKRVQTTHIPGKDAYSRRDKTLKRI